VSPGGQYQRAGFAGCELAHPVAEYNKQVLCAQYVHVLVSNL
jgi:hypothetical protein